MRRFLLPNSSVITEKALRDLYRKVRMNISTNRDKGDVKSITEETLAALETFFKKLGKPQFEETEIQPEDPVVSQELNDILEKITNDIGVGYEEAVSLRDAAVATHNFASIVVSELQRRADEVAGLVTDLRLVSGQHGEEVIVFSDNFVDESKIDSGFPTEYPEAQTMPGQGALTLNRTEATTATADDVVVEVTPLTGITREPNQDNTGRFYEGHFYSFLGEAEPEGGVFHISEEINEGSLAQYNQSAFKLPEIKRNASGKLTRKSAKALRNFVLPGGRESAFLERVRSGLYNGRFPENKKGKETKWLNARRNRLHRLDRGARKQFLYYYTHPDEAAKVGYDIDPTDIPLTVDNFIPMDKGATEEELVDQRAKMLDGNPASYWQCELVRDAKTIQDYVNKLTEGNQRVEISPDELRNMASLLDKEDLEVEIVFKFSEPRVLSWITLNPITFDDGAYLEVTDVSTAQDLDSEYSPVDSFVSGSFSRTLTDEANEEVPGAVASMLLAPSRYSYRGMGIWPFSARVVQKVRVRVKQKTPVPNPYERYVLEATRTTANARI